MKIEDAIKEEQEKIKKQKSMSIDDAINFLNHLECHGSYYIALQMAIRSLLAWENMKNELEEFLDNLRELHEWGRVLGVEQAVDIVNKYLQEVEE